MQVFHGMTDDFAGNASAAKLTLIARLFLNYSIPRSLKNRFEPPTIDFISKITTMAISLGGNFKTSPFTDLLKRFEGNPVMLVRSIKDSRSRVQMGDLRSLLQSVTEEILIDEEAGKMNRRLLEETCESNLYVLRYFAVFVVVSVLQMIGPGTSSITNRLFAILSARVYDTNARIRQLANIGGYVENFLLHKSTYVSLDQISLAFRDSLRDPCPTVKIAVLKYMSETFTKNRESCEQIRPISRTIGDEVVSLCFDASAPAVSAQALKLLSDPIVGEMLLHGDESRYQALSLLVWKVVWSSTRIPQPTISKEALKFVNNHVLATPGIFSDNLPASQKIQMIAEFIEQYSDGLVYHSTIAFTFAYAANLSVGMSNFLTQPKAFETVIESLVDGIKDQIVRKGTLSSLFARLDTAVKHDEECEVSLKLRLNTVLEIMCNSMLRFDIKDVISDRVLLHMGELFECWDEAEEPCEPTVSIIGETQADALVEAARSGIRPRRFCFEVVHEMLNLRFSDSVRPASGEDLQQDIEKRVLMFQMTKNAINRSLT